MWVKKHTKKKRGRREIYVISRERKFHQFVFISRLTVLVRNHDCLHSMLKAIEVKFDKLSRYVDRICFI